MLACGAELKSTFCLAKGGRAWVGHHIGDLKNYETLARSATGSSTSSGCSTIEPARRRPRPPPRLPLDRATRSSATASSSSASSTTTPTSPRASPSTARRAGRRRDLRRHRLRHRRHGLGRRAPRRRPARLRARRPPLPGAAARRRRGGPRAVADGLRLARGRARGRAPAGPPALAASGRAGRWARSPRCAASGLASPLTTSAGRLFDAVAALCGVRAARQLRGPGGDRARGASRDRGERGAYPMPLIDEGDGPLVLDARATIARRRRRPRAGGRRGGSPPASTTALAARDGRGLRARGRARAGSTASCSPAACSRTGCCSSAIAAGCSGARAARARPRAAAAQRRRHLLRPGGGRGGARRGEVAAMSFGCSSGRSRSSTTWLTDLFAGAPLLVALGIAFVLGLRHASDPDHLVAVTSLVAAEDGDVRARGPARRLVGAGPRARRWSLIGLPLIALKSELPGWLERAAEKGVGRDHPRACRRVLSKWLRGDYRVGSHDHGETADHERSRRPPPPAPRRRRTPRTPRRAPRGRRSGSASCTASPAPARSSCC